MNGDIYGAGSSVTLTTAKSQAADITSHDVKLATGSVIDVSGAWINDSPSVTTTPGTEPTPIDGGSVTLSAAGNVLVGPNSEINVSGGGWINSTNQVTEGKAGAITLSATYAPTPAVTNGATSAYIGSIDFGGGVQLLGNSLSASGGGTLTLQSGSITVGPTSAGHPASYCSLPVSSVIEASPTTTSSVKMMSS